MRVCAASTEGPVGRMRVTEEVPQLRRVESRCADRWTDLNHKRSPVPQKKHNMTIE